MRSATSATRSRVRRAIASIGASVVLIGAMLGVVALTANAHGSHGDSDWPDSAHVAVLSADNGAHDNGDEARNDTCPADDTDSSVASGDRGALPNTGAGVALALGAGVLLVAGGAGLALYERRASRQLD